MARFPRTGSVTISFPRFSGITSQLVLANLAVFFVLLLLEFAAPRMALVILSYFSPVSYTHLDVYKRQQQEQAPAGPCEKSDQSLFPANLIICLITSLLSSRVPEFPHLFTTQCW